ncbi:hypothetical protein ACQKFK_32405 [Bacillus mycoides]|uniref:hypothetical protein n=1 Tax=Bacillus mycoides TaxID=1405 RepID=UPI003CFFB7CF
MSTMQQHMDSRRSYIFERLKQPGYLNKSIQMIQQAKKELDVTIEEMLGMWDLNTQSPCLPSICGVQIRGFKERDIYKKLQEFETPQLWDMSKNDREQLLDETLAFVNEVFNLQRTMFVMLYEHNQSQLMDLYQKQPENKTQLHYDVSDGNGFNKKEYVRRIHSLQQDIRVAAFRKFCSQEKVLEDFEAFKKRYEATILPKVEEIVAIINPELAELDEFLNPVIGYGTNQISLEDMIRKLEKNLSLLHKLAKTEYCPTLEMTVEEFKFLKSMNVGGK